ncbi:hypothetical protein LCGC14_0821210 [marine sediment metagenome]|uniref:Uncharacterized protein n=1 Tax=marine sediment metagenome TaxID=412755 RepID=A0A0F9SR76_9ZZZZ
MIKRWLLGRKFCITADVYEGSVWYPIKRYFWSGGLFTKRKVDVFRLLSGRFRFISRGKDVASIQKTFECYLDNLGCTALEPSDGPTPEFVWPKGLWDA